jgi:glycosyltransferase involved in cell wall biosynthesis
MNEEYDLAVLLPVYNEGTVVERALNLLLPQVERIGAGRSWVVILIENGSPDGLTERCADRLRKKYPKHLRYLHIQAAGRGNAVREAMSQVKSEAYLSLDIDLPLAMEDISKVLEVISKGDCDMAVGKRMGSRPMVRRIMTVAVRAINWCVLGVKMSDAQCNVKAYTHSGAQILCSCEQNGY